MPSLKVPDRVGDLGDYLKEQRENARLSLRQLASVAGVSNPYLSQIERGLRRPSAEVLQQIAKGLQISAEALFLRAGLLEAAGGVEVEVAIQSDLQLTARQKRVLLDIYSTFRGENSRSAPAAATDAVASADPAAPAPPATTGAPGLLKLEPAAADAASGAGVQVTGSKRAVGKRATAKRAISKRATAKSARSGRTFGALRPASDS